jgi:hypothetical protein
MVLPFILTTDVVVDWSEVMYTCDIVQAVNM